jgi:Starch-binding module 26
MLFRQIKCLMCFFGVFLISSNLFAQEFTMYFKKPATWANAKIYFWNPSPAGGYSTTFPGVNMVQDCGDWYKYTFMGVNSINVIFTDGAGNQTVDLLAQTATRFAVPNSATGNSISVTFSTTRPTPCVPVVLPDPQVMMQAWYWDYPKTGHGASWADTLRLKAADMKKSGISHVWFPPHVPASFGNKSNGYDPKDLFMGNTTTGLGTRPKFNAMMQEFGNQGIKPVGDMIYNHRDGGKAENNSAVKAYITTHMAVGKAPFPSDRVRCILPVGGATGNGAGTYYFKIASKTNDAGFNGKTYKFYAETNIVGKQNLPDQTEVEPNGGGNCSPSSVSTLVTLGRTMNATVEAGAVSCNVDEFQLNLSASDFNASGDTITIYLTNTGNGGYSDHRIYGIYKTNAPAGDVVNQLQYQTYTDFSNLPSGRGGLNFEAFKPNSANAATTSLSGDWDSMLFFYDYDQFQPQTRDTLIAWTKWSWDIGIRGLRMDAIKHFTPDFVGDMLNAMYADNKIPDMVVGEWYGADVNGQKNWLNAVNARMNVNARAAISPKVFDFLVRDKLKAASDNNADPRDAFGGNLNANGVSGFNIVPFLNNHDFRSNNPADWDALVFNDAILGYAFLLTNNQLGVPTIFYPDYYGYPQTTNVIVGGQPRKVFIVNSDTLYYDYLPQGKPAYKTQIDKLLKVAKNYINGSQGVDYLNNYGNTVPVPNNYIKGSVNKSMIYQMSSKGSQGGKEIIVAINYGTDSLKVDHKITETRNGIQRRNVSYGITGTKFNDVLKNSAFSQAITDELGRIFISLPPKSYSVWVQETCQTNTVESIVSGEWTDPLTWMCGRVPKMTDTVYINSNHIIKVSTNEQAKKIEFIGTGKVDLIGIGSIKLNP